MLHKESTAMDLAVAIGSAMALDPKPPTTTLLPDEAVSVLGWAALTTVQLFYMVSRLPRRMDKSGSQSEIEDRVRRPIETRHQVEVALLAVEGLEDAEKVMDDLRRLDAIITKLPSWDILASIAPGIDGLLIGLRAGVSDEFAAIRWWLNGSLERRGEEIMEEIDREFTFDLRKIKGACQAKT